MAKVFTAKDAAERYAQDETFAEEFEQALAVFYREQLGRLERIAARAGLLDKAEQLPLARAPFIGNAPAPESFVDPEKVHQVLARANTREGLTRGQIAKALGVDNRNPGLTHALRALKEQGRMQQTGGRRAARYSTPLSREPRRGSGARS